MYHKLQIEYNDDITVLEVERSEFVCLFDRGSSFLPSQAPTSGTHPPAAAVELQEGSRVIVRSRPNTNTSQHEASIRLCLVEPISANPRKKRACLIALQQGRYLGNSRRCALSLYFYLSPVFFCSRICLFRSFFLFNLFERPRPALAFPSLEDETKRNETKRTHD
ncbi:uncharacterized protein EI90DRAFT_1729608 [Cantharellus anzutake]|uniref:uncharacterized protein n=1 Tax=Cantharellus anzutake TaxID=1750568 RepID=UPI001907D77E|nr:uncharacterized protein EI90DRAFT_1729608 [Cantharellus anzutake]KAF8341381.1 hypothetical protein EI90DRAFT_1729608 [Cantharellus anzutake]